MKVIQIDRSEKNSLGLMIPMKILGVFDMTSVLRMARISPVYVRNQNDAKNDKMLTLKTKKM